MESRIRSCLCYCCFIYWGAVEKSSVYYEVYEKGHRAPNDEYGRVVQVLGPLMEIFLVFLD